MKHHIKANLPRNKEQYDNGNGEGVWVLISQNVKNAYDNNETGQYECELDNFSFYFRDLTPGDIIPLELRGDLRPVVPISFLEALKKKH